MITDEEIEKAVDWLAYNAVKAAKCRAERLYLEDYTRVLKAIIMNEHPDLAVNAQEREAYSDDRYKEHLLALRIAIDEDEKNFFLRNAAETKIKSWQTMCSNNRAIKV